MRFVAGDLADLNPELLIIRLRSFGEWKRFLKANLYHLLDYYMIEDTTVGTKKRAYVG